LWPARQWSNLYVAHPPKPPKAAKAESRRSPPPLDFARGGEPVEPRRAKEESLRDRVEPLCCESAEAAKLAKEESLRDRVEPLCCESAEAAKLAKEEKNANSPRMSAVADRMSAKVDNSFGMRSYEQQPRRFYRMPLYRLIGLKASWNQGFTAVRRCRSALALVYAGNSFGIRTYGKRLRKFFRMRTCKFIALKAPWNEHLQKKGGGGGVPAAWPRQSTPNVTGRAPRSASGTLPFVSPEAGCPMCRSCTWGFRLLGL
jgi:hypothetical protein